jgi:hypothetical protein
MELFEVGSTDSGCSTILPFRWMAKHPPQNADKSADKVRFNKCENCTEATANEFSLVMDPEVLKHGEALVIRRIDTSSKEMHPLSTVLDKFLQWTHIMTQEAADYLPEHMSYDHAIDLKEGEIPSRGPVYVISEKELEVLREGIKDMLVTGNFRRSKSPAPAPMLFVSKAHGKCLQLCVDYRGINKITIANRYPPPIMSELQDQVCSSKSFTKMDLKNSYHLIRIKEGDEWQTAFRCRYRLFGFMVIPFSLTNAPAILQDMINHILKDLLDKGVVAIIDDIFIYATSQEQHNELVPEVLLRLGKHKLVISHEKCG